VANRGPRKDGLSVGAARTRSLDLERLAERLADLEGPAYQEFADHFGPRFRALFLRSGLVASDAEDLAVSCITDIALKVRQYRRGSSGSFESWVLTLARHALIDWWRRHRPSQPLFEDDLVRDVPEADPEVLASVQEAMEQLSEDDQAIIRLRDLGRENSYTEIAQQLGIQSGAARTRHLRALQRLGSILKQDARLRVYLDRAGGRGTEKGDD